MHSFKIHAVTLQKLKSDVDLHQEVSQRKLFCYNANFIKEEVRQHD